MKTVSISVYDRICSLLQEQDIRYRVMLHESEGNTELASRIRGHELRKAAKSMVVSLKKKSEVITYMLAVIPGDRRVNFKALKKNLNLYDASLAPQNKASELTYCQMGAVPPFSFHQELSIVVDPLVLENDEIVFNAGLLDKSIVIDVKDYLQVVQPREILSISNEQAKEQLSNQDIHSKILFQPMEV